MAVAVAALTLWYHLVFCLMAGYASQFAVLEFTCGKQIICFLMAGGAIFRRCFVVIGNILRHVCLMTLLTVSRGLLDSVSFVTLGAVRYFSVTVMTEAAGQYGMLALIIAQFYYLAGMTGHAGIRYIVT